MSVRAVQGRTMSERASQGDVSVKLHRLALDAGARMCLARQKWAHSASIYDGAAGIALAELWASARSTEADVESRLERWRIALSAERSSMNIRPPRGRELRGVEESLYYGMRGVYFVRLLLSFRLGRAVDEDLVEFARPVRHSGENDVIFGRAGLLLGCYYLAGVEMLSQSQRDVIVAFGDELSADLVRSFSYPPGHEVRREDLSFAHGALGQVHAALVWFTLRGEKRGGELASQAQRLCRTLGIDQHEMACRTGAERFLPGSWCNGAAGHLVALSSFGCVVAPEVLAPLRQAAIQVIASAPFTAGGLCCGMLGAALALASVEDLECPSGTAEAFFRSAERTLTWSASGAMQLFAGRMAVEAVRSVLEGSEPSPIFLPGFNHATSRAGRLGSTRITP